MNHSVARRARRDLQPVENADAGADERAERAREARHGRLAEEIAEHRDLEQELVDVEAPVGRRIVALGEEDRAVRAEAERPPVARQELRESDDDARGQRQCEVHRGEHVLEHRDHEDEEHDDRDHGHGHDDGRIDHGALDLPDQRVALLEEGGETHQDRVENTTGLARGHHVDVQIGERSGVLPERVGDGIARLHVVHHLPGDVLERLALALLRQDVERLHERKPGVDHGRELPGEDDDVARLDAATGLLAPLLVHLDDDELLPAELRHHLVAAGRVHRGVLQLSVERPGRVGERWHKVPR